MADVNEYRSETMNSGSCRESYIYKICTADNQLLSFVMVLCESNKGTIHTAGT